MYVCIFLRKPNNILRQFHHSIKQLHYITTIKWWCNSPFTPSEVALFLPFSWNRWRRLASSEARLHVEFNREQAIVGRVGESRLFLPFSLNRRLFWHHLTRGCALNSIDNKQLLDVSRVALFLPFSLNRRLFWHHLMQVCALNSIDNKQLLDVWRVALFLPFSLNRLGIIWREVAHWIQWHHLTRGCASFGIIWREVAQIQLRTSSSFLPSRSKQLLGVSRVALFLPFSLNRRLFWHHLTRGCALNSIDNKQLLDVWRVALFLPFSLNRRLFWHHLTRGCALNSIENKQLLDVSRVALFLPFSLNRRHPLASSDASLRVEFNREQVVVGRVESRSIPAI